MSDKDLIFSAARVSFRAPQEWAQFVSALKAYADERSAECVRSPIDMLQVTQGRAQASRDFFDLLSTAVAQAQKIETRQNQRPPQPR